MNKREREVIKLELTKEDNTIKALERQYRNALRDIDDKIRILQSDELTQSRIYQIQYQKALRGQVEGILDKLHGDQYATIQQYLHDSYQDGYIGTMYSIHGQGIPLIVPLDQDAAVKAIMTDSKIDEGLYKSLGVDTKKLKQAISNEISRGIASNLPFADIARNIKNRTRAPLGRAKTIVRTESHRIQQAAAADARDAAKDRGCDVVKQWDGTLDGDTRPTHRRLDGQIRETNEPFEMDGKTAMYPGDFGKPEEDCNCRCVALTRAKWALDEDELKQLKERAKFFELDKTKDFEEYKEKYLKAAAKVPKETPEPLINQGESGIIEEEEDILVPRSLGAMAANYDIDLPDGTVVHLTEGTRITNIKVIAGKGRERQIDQIEVLLDRWGGVAEEWQKKKGIGYVDYDGESYKVELHWYEERTAGRHEWKVKPDADGNWFIED